MREIYFPKMTICPIPHAIPQCDLNAPLLKSGVYIPSPQTCTVCDWLIIKRIRVDAVWNILLFWGQDRKDNKTYSLITGTPPQCSIGPKLLCNILTSLKLLGCKEAQSNSGRDTIERVLSLHEITAGRSPASPEPMLHLCWFPPRCDCCHEGSLVWSTQLITSWSTGPYKRQQNTWLKTPSVGGICYAAIVFKTEKEIKS